jgi:flavin-dependent dehydrogenase
MENTYDVIVIGAGAAGLTAAYELSKHKPKCKLIVLEARGRPKALYKRCVVGRILAFEFTKNKS